MRSSFLMGASHPIFAAVNRNDVGRLMEVTTRTADLDRHRAMTVEMLFAERNHVCAVCVANRHCELQDLADGLGELAVWVAACQGEVPPRPVDNMEALAVSREGGRTIVRIASDDNYLALQRTLLLEFELDERALPSGREDRPAALTP